MHTNTACEHQRWQLGDPPGLYGEMQPPADWASPEPSCLLVCETAREHGASTDCCPHREAGRAGRPASCGAAIMAKPPDARQTPAELLETVGGLLGAAMVTTERSRSVNKRRSGGLSNVTSLWPSHGTPAAWPAPPTEFAVLTF